MIIKNTVFLYGKMLVTVFISLLTTRLILQNIGESQYGLYTILWSVVALITFINSSLIATSQRFMSIAHEHENSSNLRDVVSASFLLHSIVAVLLGVTFLF